MARMLGARARRVRCPVCAEAGGYFIDRRGQRARENRAVADWATEYEDPPEVEQRACPKGGPDCCCRHYLPGEAENLDIPNVYTFRPGEVNDRTC